MIGTLVDEYTFAVEPGKVLELARAIKDSAARYVDAGAAREEGFAGIPAPLTFTIVAGHHRDAAAAVGLLGLDIARVVVGEVGWEYERPVVAGDVLHGRRTVVDIKRKEGSRGGGMTFVTLETEFADGDGDVVVRQREVLIETGGAA
jgi:acyl dehydratase